MKILFLFLFSISLVFSANTSSDFSSFDDEFAIEKKDLAFDPLKGYNVVMTGFNDFIYINVMGPVAKGYRHIMPKPARTGISNVFHNLIFPIRLVNNLLQFKFQNSVEETARFVINSTFGIVGFNDLAYKEANLSAHNEDFGQTLAFYGVSNDIPITLPFLGPSNLRDTVGFFADGFLDPLYYAQHRNSNIFNSNAPYIFIKTFKITNEYSLHVDEYESIRKDSLDLYTLLQSIYEQHRNKMIEE